MLQLNRYSPQLIQQGLQTGLQEGRMEVAQNTVRLGIPYEKIIAATDFKEEDLRKKVANENSSEPAVKPESGNQPKI